MLTRGLIAAPVEALENVRRQGALLFILVAVCFAGRVPAQSINGGGATFPFPLYSKWSHTYHALTGARFNYQSIGSGGGIQQIRAGTVDYGTSEVPLAEADLAKYDLLQFPLVAGGVAVVANLDGIGPDRLRLTGEVVASIYLGRIQRWDDPAVAALNPGVKLPGTPISVVHRADGSGTTWLFTSYLCKVSAPWRDRVGAEKSVAWPVGAGGKGNEGVAGYVKQIPGSIGYLECTYAKQAGLSTVLLQNHDGLFVAPRQESFQASADKADWSMALREGAFLLDLPGRSTWPVVGASYVILHRTHRDAAKARAILVYFDWCLRKGAGEARDLGYVPLSDSAVAAVEKAWKAGILGGGKPVWDDSLAAR